MAILFIFTFPAIPHLTFLNVYKLGIPSKISTLVIPDGKCKKTN